MRHSLFECHIKSKGMNRFTNYSHSGGGALG